MIVVNVVRKNGSKFKGKFESQKEAEEWAKKNHSGADIEFVEEDMDNREYKMKQLIKTRDQILQATDWLFIADVKVEQKHRKIYLTYRQYLRDLPKLVGPFDTITMEKFDHWLRRNHPEEFMDGGKAEKIIYRFMYYVE